MIGRTRFDTIKRQHGGYASWAVWAEAAEAPKSNIGDLSIFDVDANPALLDTLTGDVVMVGLNISRSFSEPFRNFMISARRRMTSNCGMRSRRLRDDGAYMTDIIKKVEMVDSNDLLEHLKASPSLVQENVATFREELRDLNSDRPTILAFGAAAHRLLAENISHREYSRSIKLIHYSHRISKESYRQSVLAKIDSTADVD